MKTSAQWFVGKVQNGNVGIDDAVFPRSFFARMKFFVGTLTPSYLPRQLLGGFDGESQPNCFGDGNECGQSRVAVNRQCFSWPTARCTWQGIVRCVPSSSGVMLKTTLSEEMSLLSSNAALEYLDPRLPTGLLQRAVERGQRRPMPNRHIQIRSVVCRKAVFPCDRENIAHTFCD
jgi:hypothetical protein